ncbi:hypothetical protein BDZ45DRAFT_484646 [Acephala macrosclerotiorum]|nr:hypothetical protein BDZ45DRAFT_484646 [Acephala macrosclerotiorum]
MASLCLPIRSASDTPFRFLDLPREIRDRIYDIILSVPEHKQPEREEAGLYDIPHEVTKLRCNVETQILQTCRKIYSEAEYIMRETNLFIKVTVRFLFEEILPVLIAERLPILRIPPKKVKYFKGSVLSHEITVLAPIQEKAKTFVFLYRDLERFCKALANAQWQVSRHDEMVSHVVTLVDPYAGEKTSNLQTFYSRKLQEKLIAPYRAELRGFPHFKFKGAIASDLKKTAETEITRPVTLDPKDVLVEVEELKTQGNSCFRNGDRRGASEYWAQALMKMERVMGGKAGQRLQDAGGVPFLNSMAALTFDLNSNMAQNHLKSMRQYAGNQRLVSLFAANLSDSIFAAIRAASKYPGSTWRPTPQQVAKIAYKKAVGVRLGGEELLISQAEGAIETALNAMPGDVEIQREKQRIAQWRSRISY